MNYRPFIATLFFVSMLACNEPSSPTEKKALERQRLFSDELNKMSEIPPKWTQLMELGVEKYPDISAVIETAVMGRIQGQNTTCEFVRKHERIRTDRAWSPLPIDIHRKGKLTISPEFESTLDFTPGEINSNTFDLRVEFTRGKVFRALWRARTYPVTVKGESRCEADLLVCTDLQAASKTQYVCKGKWHLLTKITAVIDDSLKTQIPLLRKPERQKTDLIKLKLAKQNIDSDYRGVGEAFVEDFTDFQ